MNKILKHLVGIFITGIGILNMCNAGTLEYSGSFNGSLSNTNYYLFNFPIDKISNNTDTFDFSCSLSNFVGDSSFGDNGKFTLIGIRNNGQLSDTQLSYYISFSDLLNSGYSGVGFRGGANLKQILAVGYKPASTTSNISFDWNCIVTGNTIGIEPESNCDYSEYLTQEQCNEQYSGYIQQSSINSEYCLNHNLCYTCPTINKGYCKSEYNLIEPTECPICEGTGEINWSSLYLNGQQINSNAIIDITTEQQMITDIEYQNTVVDIDITYGQNEAYLNNILSGTAMTPTKEDFSTMLSDGLIAYAPYLFIGLLMIFTIGLIKKFFRG